MSTAVRNQAQPKSRARVAWIAATLAAALSVILLVVLRAPSDDQGTTTPAGMVESLVGTVWVRGTDTPVSRFLREGYAVPVGSGLRSSKNGRTKIRLASGQSLRLDTLTQVRLLGDGRVALDSGTVHVESEEGAEAGDGLTITTPFGEIHEAGARFEVRLQDDGLRIRVHEGAVDLVREDGNRRIEEGSELSIGRTNGDSPR
jgi:ferric-dicitrate binding protein FerR (iron transport regulator)